MSVVVITVVSAPLNFYNMLDRVLVHFLGWSARHDRSVLSWLLSIQDTGSVGHEYVCLAFFPLSTCCNQDLTAVMYKQLRGRGGGVERGELGWGGGQIIAIPGVLSVLFLTFCNSAQVGSSQLPPNSGPAWRNKERQGRYIISW